MQNVCWRRSRLGVDRNYGALTIITLSVKSPQEMSANLTPPLLTICFPYTRNPKNNRYWINLVTFLIPW